MVRRTKEAAQETRALILDAAEDLFSDKGVTRTSLAEIAERAGVTRGAIYWHFQNKADLFTAMSDRAILPLEALTQNMYDPDQPDPLGAVRRATDAVLALVESDARCRRVFEIQTLKCEFVDELAGHVARRQSCRQGARERLRQAVELGRRRGQLRADLDPGAVAGAMMALVDGLILDWLLDGGGYSLSAQATPLLDVFFSGLAVRQG